MGGEWLIGANTQNIPYSSIVATQHKRFWTKNFEFSPPSHKTIWKCDNEAITLSSVLAEMFNSRYINIVDKTSGKKPCHFARDNNVWDTRKAIDLIVQSHLDHSSISRVETASKNRIPSLNYIS